MPLPSPLRITAFQTIGVLYSDFAADGSGSRITTGFSIQSVTLRNTTGASMVFTLQQGNGMGGWADLQYVDVANGATVVVTWVAPGLSPVEAKFQIIPSLAGVNYDATVQYTDTNSIRYAVS